MDYYPQVMPLGTRTFRLKTKPIWEGRKQKTPLTHSTTFRSFALAPYKHLQVSGFPPFIVKLFTVAVSRDRRGVLSPSVTSITECKLPTPDEVTQRKP